MKFIRIPFFAFLIFLVGSCSTDIAQKKVIQFAPFDENVIGNIKPHDGQNWIPLDQVNDGWKKNSSFSFSEASQKKAKGIVFPVRDGIFVVRKDSFDFYHLEKFPNLESPSFSFAKKEYGELISGAERYIALYKDGKVHLHYLQGGVPKHGGVKDPVEIENKEDFFLFAFGFGIVKENKVEISTINQSINADGKRIMVAQRTATADLVLQEGEQLVPFPMGIGKLKDRKMNYFKFDPQTRVFVPEEKFDYQLLEQEELVLAGIYPNTLSIFSKK